MQLMNKPKTSILKASRISSEGSVNYEFKSHEIQAVQDQIIAQEQDLFPINKFIKMILFVSIYLVLLVLRGGKGLDS